jgi:endonuclease/exonuclease/phosphatase (EEP) superfamily protein YafD
MQHFFGGDSVGIRQFASMKRLFSLLLWAYGIGLLVFFATRALAGDYLLPVRLTSYFLPWVAGVLPPALIFAAYFRKKALSTVLLVGLLFSAFSFSYLFTNCRGQTSACEGSRTIKVMSYNVWRLNRSYAAIAEVIAKESPDVVMMQEVQRFQMQRIHQQLTRLSGHYDWSVAYDPAVDQAMISRFPIVQSQVSARNNRAQKALLRTPFGELVVINIHGYRDGWMKRHFGIESILAQDVLPDRHPLILGGDFNTTDQSETFRAVRRHLQNSHVEAGCGFGFTFPANETIYGHGFRLPSFLCIGLIRIDHIFYSRHFRAVRAYTVGESGGSDHFPVMVELEIVQLEAHS